MRCAGWNRTLSGTLSSGRTVGGEAERGGARSPESEERRTPMSTDPSREIVLISHSNLLYWWPAWMLGYIMALASYLHGESVSVPPNAVLYVHPSNNPALLFIAGLILLVIFTNTRLRGIYSIVTLISIAFVAVLMAWLGWWDAVLQVVPTLSARANMGFYLVFATAMLIVWLAAVFLFDRLTYWRVRPGQLVEERLVGGGAISHDTNGLRFQKRDQDYFRHVVLGLGAGDLELSGGGLRDETIVIPNVVMVSTKVQAIERLIAVKPEMVDAPRQSSVAM